MTRTRQRAIELDGRDAQHVEYFKKGHGIGSRTVMVRREAIEDEPFDEEQDLREDPELWTRVLADVEAKRIPEPLAIKRRRSDSISDDPESMYEAELREIDVLCEEFPELERHRDHRVFEATFRYGRGLLQAGESKAAADVFSDLIIEDSEYCDYRVYATFAVSLLPFGLSEPAFRVLEHAQEVLK